MKTNEEKLCPLCERLLAEPYNKHHLIPVSKGGRHTPTLTMHKICHDMIHAVFSEMELKRNYNTVDKLKAHEEIARFIKWVSKKEPEFYDRSVRMNRRK